MKYQDFQKRVLEHLEYYKVEKLGCTKNGVYQHKEYGYVLPKECKSLNFIQGVNPPKDIHYHMYSRHLDSSQIIGINFFEPIMSDKLLLRLLNETLKINISEEANINVAKFEYIDPRKGDDNNFNFFVEISTGERIYFEIKYTEQGFGKVSKSTDSGKLPQKYEDKFNTIYKKQLKESMYLQNLASDDKKDEFYKHYQVYRNISYIKADKDYVVFLYPYDNESLHNEMLSLANYDNVYSLDWNILVKKALEETKNTELYRKYREFYNKYLEY